MVQYLESQKQRFTHATFTHLYHDGHRTIRPEPAYYATLPQQKKITKAMLRGSVKRTIERIAADDDLEKINMKGKHIDDNQLARLSEVLASNTSITSLNLSNNNIGHEGIVALADALHQNLHVEYIDLSGNNIGNKGAATLAGCLQHNNMSVISLNLQNSGIEDEGAEAFLSALLTNSTVHSINLKDNVIHSSLLTKIDEALSRSKALFEMEVVHFDSSPAKKDQDLAAADTFSMTLSEESRGDNHSFDSSTEDDICVETSNNYILQEAPMTSSNAESSPSPLNAEVIATNWVNMFGSFFNNDEKNKDSVELRVIPVSDDEGYKEFLTFLKNDTQEDQDLVATETSLTALSHSVSISRSVSDNCEVLGTQQSSEEKDTTEASPQKNPIEATFNWIGSLFQKEEEKDQARPEEKSDKSDEEKSVLRKIPVSDDKGYQEFMAFLKT